MQRIECKNRTEWLSKRLQIKGIGASEAALVCGIKGAFGNIDELFSQKASHRKTRKVGDARIKSGMDAEPLIRQLFAIENRDMFKVEYHGYDILVSDKYPFMFCTLDGELTDLHTSEKGILEIKKVEIIGWEEKEEWDGKIPERYIAQQIHQLEVTGWAFNLLVACLSIRNYGYKRENLQHVPYFWTEYRYSYIRRDDPSYRHNADYVLKKEREFWTAVENNTRPPLRIFQ